MIIHIVGIIVRAFGFFDEHGGDAWCESNAGIFMTPNNNRHTDEKTKTEHKRKDTNKCGSLAVWSADKK